MKKLDRRGFLSAGALTITSLASGRAISAAASKDENKPAKRPNIWIITADDMGWDSPGCYGNKTPDITPHIDRLAAQSLRFNHGFVNISVCQPSRSVWITGRYPFRNGAVGFNPILPGIPMLGEQLRKAGYYTGIMAKVSHFAPADDQNWDFIEHNKIDGGRNPDHYYTISKQFLRKAEQAKKPFFMIMNIHDPHRPFAKSEHEERRFGDNPPPDPSRIYQPDEVDVPGYLPDTPEVRGELAIYYNTVKRCDDTVGKIMDVIDNFNVADDTMVMFLSDNGAPLCFAKGSTYVNSNKTPWLIRWPGVTKAGATDDDHFISGIDLMPTVLDIAGAPTPKYMDGFSFEPILKGGKQPQRDHVFTMFHRDQFRVLEMRALHTKKYGYIFNAWANGQTKFIADNQVYTLESGAKRDPKIAERLQFYLYRSREELYDYEKDPWSLNNLAEDPAYEEIRKKMQKQLCDWMVEKGDPNARTLQFYMAGQRWVW